MNQEIARKTEMCFVKLIRKPQLTEKLLLRPPFRFIYDIISAVANSVSIMEGLFTELEQNPDNLKDKESRLKYLSKVIEFVSLASNSRMDVKPSKIISGLEAEKTNFLLQKLAQVAKKKTYNDREIVSKVLATFGDQPIDSAKPGPLRSRDADSTSEEVSRKKLVRPTSAKGDKQRTPYEHVAVENGKSSPLNENHALKPPPLEKRPEQPQSAKRPSTSRKGPPQIPENSHKPSPPTEPAVEDKSSDDDFLVQEKKAVVANTEPETAEQGGLVMKLLRSREELSGGDVHPRKHVSNEKDMLEMRTLRDSVQQMTAEVNQMAKIFDISQQHEDLVLMMRELEWWRDEEEQMTGSVTEDKADQSEELTHVEGQIESLNAEISGVQLEIERISAHIIQNNIKIDYTLSSLANANQ